MEMESCIIGYCLMFADSSQGHRENIQLSHALRNLCEGQLTFPICGDHIDAVERILDAVLTEDFNQVSIHR